jgi:hypothetical protein
MAVRATHGHHGRAGVQPLCGSRARRGARARGFSRESRSRPFAWDDVRGTLADIDAQDDPEAHAIALRGLRRRVFLHTLVRDLTGLAR